MVLRAKAGGAAAGSEPLQMAVPSCECVPLGDGDGYFRGEACRRYDEWLMNHNNRPSLPIAPQYDSQAKTRSMWHDFKYGCRRLYRRKYKRAITTMREILAEDKKLSGRYACYVKSQDPRGLKCWPCSFAQGPCECYINNSGEEVQAGECTRALRPAADEISGFTVAPDPILAELIKYERNTWRIHTKNQRKYDTEDIVFPVSISKQNTDVYSRKGVGVTGVKAEDGNVGVPYESLKIARPCNRHDSCFSCATDLEERAETIERPPLPCTCDSCPMKTAIPRECAWSSSGKGIACIPCRYKDTCDCYIDEDGIERSAGACKFKIKKKKKKPSELQNLKMEIMQFIRCFRRRLKCHRRNKKDDIDVKEEYVNDWVRPRLPCGFRSSVGYKQRKGDISGPFRMCMACNQNKKICDCKEHSIGAYCKAVAQLRNMPKKVKDATRTAESSDYSYPERQQYFDDDPLNKTPCRWRTFIEERDKLQNELCDLYDGSGSCATCRDVIKIKEPNTRYLYNPPCRWKTIGEDSKANEYENIEASENENSKSCKICEFKIKQQLIKQQKQSDEENSKQDDGKSQNYTTLRLCCCNKLKPESQMLSSKTKSKSRTDATSYGESRPYEYENTTRVIEFVPSKSNETDSINENAVTDPDSTKLELPNIVNSNTKFGEKYNVMMYFRNRTKSPYELKNYLTSKNIESNMKYSCESKNVAEVESDSKSDLEAGAKVAVEAQAEKSESEGEWGAQLQPSAGFHILRPYT